MVDINPRKKRLWPFRRRHSDLRLSGDRGRKAAQETELSSPQPSQIRSGKGPLPSVRKLLRGIRNITVRGAGRSLNLAPVGSSSNGRNPIPDHIRQGPPADTAPAREQNTGQATNSGTAKDEPDLKERLADAQKAAAGMTDSSENVRITAFATNDVPSDCDAVGAVSSRSVAISPDGTRIVSGSSDKTIRMWDAETGNALGAPLQGRTHSVLSVALAPDGTPILSGSADGTIRVWLVGSLTHPQPSKVAVAATVYSPPDLTHALCSTSSFLPESYTPSVAVSDLIPTEEGWIVGPEGRLLLWIPSYFPSIMYTPGNTLVIPNGLQLDLSHFSHGTSWQMCRK